MKFKIQILTIVMFTIVSKAIYGQEVEVFIQNMSYINGGAISDCSTIDFEDNSTVTVQFGVELKKPSAMVVGNSNLRIYTKKSSTINEVERYSQDVQESFWTTGDPQFFNVSLSITLDADEFNVSGGIFYAEFESSSGNKYSGCNYSIEKDEVPTFEISPSSTTVSCGSSSPKTFTVTNVYNSPGTITYQWQVGYGWEYNESVVTNFTTTTNSVQLTPIAYPPNDVKVTPVLDGVGYPQLTANVSLSGFDPAYPIIGANQLCSTATYSVNNLPAGTTVTSWSVSNSNIATILGNGNQATLTATGNGTVNITATLTNSCNQTATITKNNIEVGAPTFPNTAMSGEYNPVVGEQKWYTVPPAIGATNYQWYFDVGNGATGTSIDGWQIIQGQGSTNLLV